jgi:putative membrane protein
MRFHAFVVFATLALPAWANAQGTSQQPPHHTQPAPANDRANDKAKNKANDKKAKLDAQQLETIAMLHHTNVMEIEAGKLAQRQGTSKVKDYGKMLVKDHEASDQQLLAFVKQHGMSSLPEHQPRTEAAMKEQQDMQDAMARLAELQGADFDRAFLNQMVLDHQRALTKVDQAMSRAKDPGYLELLRNTRPVLQRHEDRARELQQAAPEVSQAPQGNDPARPSRPQ